MKHAQPTLFPHSALFLQGLLQAGGHNLSPALGGFLMNRSGRFSEPDCWALLGALECQMQVDRPGVLELKSWRLRLSNSLSFLSLEQSGLVLLIGGLVEG